MSKALVAAGVQKRYGRQRVLVGVDLTLEEGEMVLIHGENGVGKTTLLRILAGREKPDEGRIIIYGQPLARKKARGPFAFSRSTGLSYPVRAPQAPRAFTSLTVSECFELIGGEWSTMVQAGFEGQGAMAAGSLSGGRRKALSVALAIGTGGRVIVLDEPEAGLDRENVFRVVDALAAAKAQGQTIVVSAHQSSDHLRALADRTYWLYNGALHSKPFTIHPHSSAVNLGRKPMAGVGPRLDPAGLRVNSLRIQRGETTVLDQLSFSIAPGEAVSVAGPNGSGKTSLALALAGLLRSQGVIELDGKRVDGLSAADRARRGLSLMPQAPHGLFLDLTVGENLRAVADSHRSEFSPESLLSLFPELAESQFEQARRLSGGFQRILSLAMTLRSGTRLMILDEPLAGLGGSATEKVVGILHSLKERVTVVVLEHKTEEMRAAGFEVVELADLSGREGQV